ncbi:MAG: hypothetical protein CMJ17_04230 [Phenylobacterium sp.]|nr:hypothetical protein [Phenylobacterium sp.]
MILNQVYYLESYKVGTDSCLVTELPIVSPILNINEGAISNKGIMHGGIIGIDDLWCSVYSTIITPDLTLDLDVISFLVTLVTDGDTVCFQSGFSLII